MTTTMRLVDKAKEFDQMKANYLNRSVSHTPFGLVVDVDFYDDGRFVYGEIVDAAIWTGVYIASQGFRFAVTNEQQAIENMERSLRAVQDLRMITGKEGLIARGFLKDFYQSRPDWRQGTGDYQGYVWRGDASRDGYLGVFFGLGIASQYIQSAETKHRAVEDIRSLANHLIDNGLRIIDVDGKPTEHGSFSNKVFGIPLEALGALMALSVIRTAHRITGDEKFKSYYEQELIRKKGYHRTANRFLQLGLRLFGNYINDNLAFLALFSLITSEDDTRLKSGYLSILDQIWKNRRGDLNSFFNVIHHGLLGKDSGEEAIRDAIDSLKRFPFPLENKDVKNSKDPNIPKAKWPFLRDRQGKAQSRHPLPMDIRVRGNFMWKDNPRRLDGGRNNFQRFHPVAYLISYWMGRYYDLIGPDE